MTSRLDVLVVEDERVVREAARRILLGEELAVATANDVGQAVGILESTPCRLVLSDLMLPGASGFDLLKLARDRWPSMAVIVITGYATLENALTAFREGAFDFVPKPFDVGELLGAVRRALRFSTDTEQLQAPSPSTPDLNAGGGSEDRCFLLGGHSWARLHADGSATLGAAETFRDLMEEIALVNLPGQREHPKQGKLLARILTPQEIVYRVWSPLSGVVLATNPILASTPNLVNRDPFGEGWLAHIIPDNLDRELDLLIDADGSHGG